MQLLEYMQKVADQALQNWDMLELDLYNLSLGILSAVLW